MSWLDGKIKNVLNKKSGQIDAALAAVMTEVMDEYQARYEQNALRVHDDAGEGILYGTRNNTVRNPGTEALELTSDRLMIQRGREEAFTRALFNQKQILVEGAIVNLVSYEAPLLRRHEGKGGNICKVDLIGISKETFWALEYKQTCGAATSARYGVIESLAYGMLLARHIQDNPENMSRQVERCLTKRGPFPGVAIPFNVAPSSVKFAVVAPASFYREDTRTSIRRLLTQQFAEAACRYAADVSRTMGIDLGFGGYLVIDDDDAVFDERDLGVDNIVRTYKSPQLKVPVFNTITKVHDFLNQRS